MPISRIVDQQLRQLAQDDTAYTQLRALFERQQAHTTLRDSETFNRTVVQQAPVAIYVHDIDKDQVVYGNPAYEAQLGYSLDRVQLLGSDLTEHVYHPDDVALRRATDKMLLADRDNSLFINVYRVIRSDGETRWVATREMVLHRHPNGTPRQIIGIGQDITEFQATTDALAASKEAMQRLIQQLPVGIQVFNISGLCTDVNDIHLEIFGAERDALVNHYNIFADKWSESLAIRDAALRALRGETVYLGDITFDFQYGDPRYARLDRGRRTINVTMVPIFDEHDDVTSFVGVNVDVSERKRIENELRESQRQYRDLANSITDVFYALNDDLCFTFWNTACERLTGVLAAAAIGQTLYDLFPRVTEVALDRVYLEVLHSRQTRSIEYPYTINDEERHFEATVYPAPNGINVITRDVTERVLAHQRSFELKLQKERSLLLANFIEKVSHEFRTPLSTIGTSVYLMTRTQDHERLLKRADQVQGQIARIARLVDMQLLMVRLDSDVVLNMKPLDLNKLCQTVQAGYTSPPALHYRPGHDLPPIVGNADLLETALAQLLENARHHTPPEGSITLATGHDPHSIWVEVADTGSGIAPENHVNVFKAFWREDLAHTHPGFGLGLPIVQRIAETHGGTVYLDSAIGVGSRFRMIFPHFTPN